MKSLRNTVHLIGRIGNDPEFVEFGNGNRKASFSLATSDSYKNKEGEKVENTQWHRLVVFGPKVKVVEQYLKKGMEICIEGNITYNQWEDKSGQKHYATDIVVNDILMLGGNKK